MKFSILSSIAVAMPMPLGIPFKNPFAFDNFPDVVRQVSNQLATFNAQDTAGTIHTQLLLRAKVLGLSLQKFDADAMSIPLENVVKEVLLFVNEYRETLTTDLKTMEKSGEGVLKAQSLLRVFDDASNRLSKTYSSPNEFFSVALQTINELSRWLLVDVDELHKIMVKIDEADNNLKYVGKEFQVFHGLNSILSDLSIVVNDYIQSEHSTPIEAVRQINNAKARLLRVSNNSENRNASRSSVELEKSIQNDLKECIFIFKKAIESLQNLMIQKNVGSTKHEFSKKWATVP